MFTCRWARVPEGVNLKVSVWVPVGAEQSPGSVTSTFALLSATAPPPTLASPRKTSTPLFTSAGLTLAGSFGDAPAASPSRKSMPSRAFASPPGTSKLKVAVPPFRLISVGASTNDRPRLT